MYKHISILLVIVLFLFSCSGKKQEHNVADNKQDMPSSLNIVVIADLPDSVQPIARALDTMPLPRSKSATGIKSEQVNDSTGNSFITSSGGISHFTTLTTDNGLALDGVSCSIKDKAGSLWFGTLGGGVSRYDGKSFTTFTTDHGLANNIVACILEDRMGNLWFGTNGGVSRYDGKSFITFTTAQGLANNQAWSIAEDRNGNLWFGTLGGGVSRYDGKSFTTFNTSQGLANNNVRSITQDRANNLWFGTLGGGVSRYNGRSFTTFTVADGLANDQVWGITEDRAGNLWFATLGGGVSRYDGKIFTRYTTAQGLANNDVRSIAEDRYGKLWFGTNGGGVSCYDGKSFISFTTAQGLANNQIWSITEDREGNIWFGTLGGGVNCYGGAAFTSFTTAQGLGNNDVRSMAEDSAGHLWIGMLGGGVSRYNGRSFTNFTTSDGIANNDVRSIVKDHAGNFWIGTRGGVTCYDGKRFTTYTIEQGLASNDLRSIAEDRAGNLWFGTNGSGVSRFDGKCFTTFTTREGLANNTVLSITVDRADNIWFGTLGGGVSRYDGSSFITFKTGQGLADNIVLTIMEDHAGNLWFGTSEGLSVLGLPENDALFGKNGTIKKGNKVVGQIFRTFTKMDGLPDNFITQILQRPDSKIVLGTNLGITMFSPSADLTKLTCIDIYNVRTGYPVKDVNTGLNGMLMDRKGVIWAGTGSHKTALIRFDAAALPHNSDTPVVVIKNVQINEQNICWYDLDTGGEIKPVEMSGISTPPNITEEMTIMGRPLTGRERDSMKLRFGAIRFDGISHFYPIPQKLVLPYKCNRITIDFNAVETSKPELVNYKYILEGYDNSWSRVVKKNNITFGNMREGEYTFRLKAQGPNGVWSEPIAYSFRVLPPWYRMWWAYSAYGLLFLLALRMFNKWREGKLRDENERLEKTVEKRTEELLQKNIIVEKERRRSEELLLNILPEEVSEELKNKGFITGSQFDNVTVLFTDFVNFTQAGERLTPQQLVDELHACFKAFDEITDKYNIEKIKTVGDAYLAVSGLPAADPKHAENIVRAAMEISTFMQRRIANPENNTFHIRIGVHSGSVVAGIVGVRKFAYDIWGDAVNTAARMEQNCAAGRINISETTHALVKEQFLCEFRGEIEAKGKGALKMYYIL